MSTIPKYGIVSRVEDFIVESLKELNTKDAREVVSHFDQPWTISDEGISVARAIRGYFARRARILLHQLTAGPGLWVTLAKGTLHHLKNISAIPAKMLIIATPTGLDQFLLEAG
jgi:hypothetical protein